MDLRPSPIAGRWYPSAIPVLTQKLDEYLNAAQVEAPPGDIVGLIVPHAGHIYSGPVAAYAYQAARGLAVDVVVIFSPSHFHADGPLLTSGHEAYATPLGAVPVDREALAQLRPELNQTLQHPFGEMLVEIQHDREHAIEIQLPFLQRVLAPGFMLLPIMLRDQSEPVARALGQATAKVLAGRRALIVGSSDLSHFFSQETANQLDAEVLKHIAACDPAGVLEVAEEGTGQACGHGAIAAALWAAQARGADHAKVLKYATSGDVTGDQSEVVGYGAAIMWKESK